MIAIERKKLEQVLEALEMHVPNFEPLVRTQADNLRDNAITAIKETLAQPDYRAVKTYHEGKPVYVSQPEQELEYCADYHCAGDCGQPHNQQEMQAFLVTQPKRPWVGLTDEEIDLAWPSPAGTNSIRAVAKAIEAKLKEKNT